MLITQKVELNLQKPGMSVRVDAVQDDCYTRSVEVVLHIDGIPWMIPEGTLVGIRYRKQDMTGGYYDTLPSGDRAYSIHDNVVTIMLAPQMTTTPGLVVAQLELMKDSQILATGKILLNVVENPAAGVLTSEDYMNWLQWMEAQLQESLQQALESGTMVGPAGAPAELVSSSVMYQTSSSGTDVPQGAWRTSVPTVKSGEYLWTRAVYEFNSGEPVIQYSVCKSGSDGISTRKIKKTLYAAGWSTNAPYTQSIVLEEILEEEYVCAYPEITADNLEEKIALNEALGKIRWCTRSGNVLTFECLEDRPLLDIPVIVEVYV